MKKRTVTTERRSRGEELRRKRAENGKRMRTVQDKLTRAQDELELRVQQRTAELCQANEALQAEMRERQRVEEALRESEKDLRNLSSQLFTAHEEERRRIARELHDSIGQMLAATKFSLERRISQMEKEKAPPGISLEEILVMIQDGIDETRRIMTNLRPSILDDLGIVVTLSWFCREFQKVYAPILIQKEVAIAEGEIPEHLKIVVFRILQEAVNNVVKHSQCSQAIIRLAKTKEGFELQIQDNGRGFDGEGVQKGLGLTSMKERIEFSGGNFVIESTRGKGTIVKATWFQ
jgi:signal transduction histidine kinase